MERSSAPDLAARVARLEWSSRRDRAIVLAVAVVALATAQTGGPSVSPTIASAPIVVRGPSGSATLTSRGLTVRDAAGHDRTFSGVDADGRPSVDLSDSGGQLRESMYLLEFRDPDTKRVVDQLPVLRQFDKSGKRRAEIRLDSDNDGELLLNDANEKLRLAIFRTKAGDPQLGLYGNDEKLRAYFSTDDDSPYLVMRDRGGTTRVYAGGYKDGSVGIDVRNAANTVLWKAP